MFKGLKIVDLVAHKDQRGSFQEIFRQEWNSEFTPLQTNISIKEKNSLVGLHYHKKQWDYWHLISGEANFVFLDLREDSMTYGKKYILSENLTEIGVYIPPGVAHGFAAKTNIILLYHTTRYYDPEDENELPWQVVDLELWGIDSPILSKRDSL